MNASHRRHRFVTFFAVHFSLEYILFSDVVLEYITPILTGFSGAIFLKERLSSKHVCAGCKHS